VGDPYRVRVSPPLPHHPEVKPGVDQKPQLQPQSDKQREMEDTAPKGQPVWPYRTNRGFHKPCKTCVTSRSTIRAEGQTLFDLGYNMLHRKHMINNSDLKKYSRNKSPRGRFVSGMKFRFEKLSSKSPRNQPKEFLSSVASEYEQHSKEIEQDEPKWVIDRFRMCAAARGLRVQMRKLDTIARKAACEKIQDTEAMHLGLNKHSDRGDESKMGSRSVTHQHLTSQPENIF